MTNKLNCLMLFKGDKEKLVGIAGFEPATPDTP